MIIDNIISLLLGVSLFLFGMALMGDGLKSVAGNKLEVILYKLSNTPLKGILLGAGVTAVVQSSSASSIMVIGFVNSGMMKLRQAIGIILGAILGTSITGWIIALSSISSGTSDWLSLISTVTLTSIIGVVGIIFRLFCKSHVYKKTGNIMMGFVVLMTGISVMTNSVSGIQDNELFISLFSSFSNPLFGILGGILVTAVLQSASASIGILQALSVTGLISFDIALPIIIGISIGAALPVLLSAISAGTEGKRTAFSYLFANLFGSAVIFALFTILNTIFRFPFSSSPVYMVEIALINTIFRFLIVLIMAPCIPLLEKLVTALFKEDPNKQKEYLEIDKLETRFLTHPALAIEQSFAAVCSMAMKVRKNLSSAFDILYNYSDGLYDSIQEKEEIIDKYEDKLGTYLVKLTGKDLTEVQGSQITMFLHAIGDYERIADHAVNLSNVAKEIYEKKISFSVLAEKEMSVLMSAVSEIVINTNDAFVANDIELAKKVEPLEQVIDDLCDKIKINHIKRVRAGDCTLEIGYVFNDLLSNFERISDHCSNIAVAIIELSQDCFDTHQYLNEVKTTLPQDFNTLFEEYERKYKLD